MASRQLRMDSKGVCQTFMNFIIADADMDYTAALANRIHQINPALQIDRCHRSEDLQRLIAAQKEQQEQALFLYNKRDFVELAQLSQASVWPEAWESCPMEEGQSHGITDSTTAFCFKRYDPVSRLTRQYHDFFYGQMRPAEEQDCLSKSIDQKGVFDDQTSSCRLWCSTSFSPDVSRNHHKRLHSLVQTGRQIIYLPLMPAYLMYAVRHVKQGPSLSDLLLEISQGTIKASDIGRFWYPQPDGFLCFRPPARSDDLVTCDSELIRRLVQLFREKIQSDPSGQMTGLIDCVSLPVSTLRSIAVQCDVCEFIWPDDDLYAAQSAQYEAASVMAALPAGCQIIQNGYPVQLHSESKGGFQIARPLA